MMFWFKRKEIVVDCFTTYDKHYNMYYPKRASSFLPEWWKKLPSTYEEPLNFDPNYKRTASTMRHCVGFKDLYLSGFIMPLWSDVDFYVSSEKYIYVFADCISSVSSHPSKQFGPSFANYHHAKFVPPWLLREKTGVKFMFVEPTWSYLGINKNLRLLPGITQYDLYSQPNINMFIAKEQNEYKFQIQAGDPLCHLVPLSDKKVKIKKHLVMQNEYDSLNLRNTPSKFNDGFHIYRKFMQGKEKDEA